MILQRRFLFLMLAVIVVLGGGTAGYMIIEGWNFLDSLFMTSITLATVGYGETHPLSPSGRIFTLIILFLGMGVIVSGASVLTSFVVDGELQEILRRRKMKKTIGRMKNHTIICGAGRTGMHVITEMKHMKVPFVVVESVRPLVEELRRHGIHVVEGDAALEETLTEAGIERAGRLITCLTNDKDNLFVVLTARSMNAKVRIVARFVDDHSAEKFRKAGVDALVSPNAIGGLRMASIALRPAVVSFLDKMLRSGDGSLRVEQATVQAGSKLANKTLKEAKIGETAGVLVTATVLANDEYKFNPAENTRLVPGLVIIVMGEIDKVKKLKEMAGEN